jgi:hypothetical protein
MEEIVKGPHGIVFLSVPEVTGQVVFTSRYLFMVLDDSYVVINIAKDRSAINGMNCIRFTIRPL